MTAAGRWHRPCRRKISPAACRGTAGRHDHRPDPGLRRERAVRRGSRCPARVSSTDWSASTGRGRPRCCRSCPAPGTPTAAAISLAVDRRRVAVCPDVPDFDGWLTAREVVDLARSLVAPGRGQARSRRGAAHRRAGRRGRPAGGGVLARHAPATRAGVRAGQRSRAADTRRADVRARPGRPGGACWTWSPAMRGRRTVIFSSHILADVQRVADHVGILRDGRLLYQGRSRELHRHLPHAELAGAHRRRHRTGGRRAWPRQPWATDVERPARDAPGRRHEPRGG